jgi:hypothetical protein
VQEESKMFATTTTTIAIRRRLAAVALLATTLGVFAGCNNPTQPAAPQIPVGPPTQQRSGIAGTASAVPGVNANLGGLRITAHASLDHLRNYVRSGLAQVQGSGLNVSWQMQVTPGTYFILAWMDMNNDGYLSYGDVAGIVGQFGLQSGEFTPVQVWEGQTAQVGDIRCEVIYGKPAWLEGDRTDK